MSSIVRGGGTKALSLNDAATRFASSTGIEVWQPGNSNASNTQASVRAIRVPPLRRARLRLPRDAPKVPRRDRAVRRPPFAECAERIRRRLLLAAVRAAKALAH